MCPLDVPVAQAGIGVPDGTEMPVIVVWGVLTGAGFVVVLGTGLLAWWLGRLTGSIDLDRPAPAPPASRVPRPRAAPDDQNADDQNADRQDADRRNADGQHPDRPRRTLTGPLAEAGREYAELRAAAARAATVAAQARKHSDTAALELDTAELRYEQARLARELSRPEPAAVDPDAQTTAEERVVARAALAAYRRGELSAEQLRQVWYGASGWDADREAAERELLRLHAAEVAARHRYHLALATARTAERDQHVAETALHALGAEAAAAAKELAAAYDRIDGRRSRRRS